MFERPPGLPSGPHATLADKLLAAHKSRNTYGESRSVFVDNLSGSMHRAYGSFPNMVYVINPDGVVVYRCDRALPDLIDQVLSNRQKLHLAERKRIVTAVPWVMVPVTLKGGWDALWDLVIALPGILWGHVKADSLNKFTERPSLILA